MAAAAGVTNLTHWSDLDEIQTQMFANLPLEDFVSATAQTLQDLGQHLRRHQLPEALRGREAPHLLHREGPDDAAPRGGRGRWPQAANDARVAIDTIETGGIYVGQPGDAAGLMPEGRWNQTFAFKTLRNVSEFTGGVSSIAEDGVKAMDRINDVTRATYLLGYYPTNAKWDGTYRKVEIKVSRPGVTVLTASGYYGRKDLFAFNRRDFITQRPHPGGRRLPPHDRRHQPQVRRQVVEPRAARATS